jgi:hypothetical protein
MKDEYGFAKDEFVKLRNTMIEDLEKINQLLIEDPLNECLIRVSARTLYSFIETSSYIWKNLAYLRDKRDSASGKIEETSLSEEEISAIFESSYYVDENGEAKGRSSYIEPARNLKFALRVFAKTHGLDYAHIFDEKGWDAYRKGLKIRNRLTHPKADSDLFISEEEHNLLHEVFDWFFGTIIFLGTDTGKVH